ncbi:hypothetical protein D3A96_12120 [Robertkochia marina]|nr:hypothetical protein D3A96_12120 [Robertkochia marina]
MIDFVELGKGCLFLIAAFIFFKIFHKPLGGDSMLDRLVDFKATVGMILLVICGIAIIYGELARINGWVSF